MNKLAFFRTHAAAVWYNKLGNVTLKQKLDEMDAQMGVVLWENPNQTAEFSPQTINLLSADYDTYEIFYRYYNTNSDIYAEKSIKGHGTSLTNVLATDSGVVAYSRNVQYISEKQIKFMGGYHCTSGNVRILDNGTCVPVRIVGYKA